MNNLVVCVKKKTHRHQTYTTNNSRLKKRLKPIYRDENYLSVAGNMRAVEVCKKSPLVSLSTFQQHRQIIRIGYC